MKKIVFLICQLAIILLPYFLIWSDSIIILGLAAIIAQFVLSLNFIGWVSAVAYPITYWCAVFFDTPQAGNQYVYWYLSYFGITILVLAVELILRFRKWLSEPTSPQSKSRDCMKCPYFNNEMTSGYIPNEQQPVQWIPNSEKTPLFSLSPAEKGVALNNEFSPLRTSGYKTKAYYCNTCSIVIAYTE